METRGAGKPDRGQQGVAIVLDGIHLMSLTPGRLRLKVRDLKHSKAFATTLCERLAVLPGIKKVEANQATCSLLVLYDQYLFTADSSVATLQQALVEQLSPEERELLRSILHSKEIMHRLQQALAELMSPPEQDRFHALLQSLVA